MRNVGRSVGPIFTPGQNEPAQPMNAGRKTIPFARFDKGCRCGSITCRAAHRTPSARGLVLFGDMGGNFYALDAATSQKLWGQKIGGGVITYTANGAQKVAVTTGYISPAVPIQIRRTKIAILALGRVIARSGPVGGLDGKTAV
jgi:hypothetical protein